MLLIYSEGLLVGEMYALKARKGRRKDVLPSFEGGGKGRKVEGESRCLSISTDVS